MFSKTKEHFSKEEINETQIKFIDLFSDKTKRANPIKLFLKFFKGYYLKLFISAVFYFIKSAPIWAIPIITADVIDVVTKRPDDIYTRLIIDCVLAIFLLVQNIPFHYLYMKYFSEAVRSVEAGLRGAMVRKLQQLSITFHKEMESGKIHSKVMRDVESVADFALRIYETVLDIVFNMSITLIVVITRNISVFFMFLVCIPLAVVVTKKFKKRMKRQSHDFRVEMENTSSAVFDMEQLIPVTRAHALENTEIERITTNVTQIARSGYHLDMVQSLFGSINWVLFYFFKVVCLFFTGYLALKGTVSIGEITLYQSYFGTLIGYVSSIIGLLPVIAKGTESISSIGEILFAYDIEDNKNKKKLKELNGNYVFNNVSFDYDNRTHVLKDFNFNVKAGETVALVGESGSGKSTIMNLIIGFNKAQSGEVIIDGENINNIDLHSYRKMISVVPQNTILFSGTIRENIVYGRPDISDEELNEVIKMARLEKVIEALPDGLNTMVGEHGSKLSGGQRQRISIARAIIRKPRVIIFDEATSALDSVTEREIQAAIDNLTKDRTTFIVAHRLSTIKNADKIAVIREGRCVESGTYDELLAKKGEFYNYKITQS